MIPTCCGGSVLPVKPDFVTVVLPETVVFRFGEMKLVAAEIGTEIELVFLAEVKVEFGIEVEEIVARRHAVINEFHYGHHKEVKIGGAAGNHERGLVFNNGTFNHEI